MVALMALVHLRIDIVAVRNELSGSPIVLFLIAVDDDFQLFVVDVQPYM